MKQPHYMVPDYFELDGRIENSAEIVVFYEYLGKTEKVLRIPFSYSHEAGTFENFVAEIQRAATKLADCYAYWPVGGYIPVQTRITKDHVNGV